MNRLDKNVLKSSALIAVILTAVGSLLIGLYERSWFAIILFLFFSFAFVFFFMKTSLREFILAELRKVYDSSLFENEPFLKRESKELDFERFLAKVKSFAENKHDEVQQLHDRDDFRKEFMGDVSHELKTPLFTAQGYLLTVLDGNMDDPKLEKKYLLFLGRPVLMR